MCFALNSGTGKQYGILLCIGQTDETASLQQTERERNVQLRLLWVFCDLRKGDISGGTLCPL
jgi:hypothetical protein